MRSVVRMGNGVSTELQQQILPRVGHNPLDLRRAGAAYAVDEGVRGA
ncbi:MAG: hypothetical protein OSB03_19720 [Vicinamibacterales bacterium]|nr:hypothetical protein [Vicinamibacterales bacterium]